MCVYNCDIDRRRLVHGEAAVKRSLCSSVDPSKGCHLQGNELANFNPGRIGFKLSIPRALGMRIISSASLLPTRLKHLESLHTLERPSESRTGLRQTPLILARRSQVYVRLCDDDNSAYYIEHLVAGPHSSTLEGRFIPDDTEDSVAHIIRSALAPPVHQYEPKISRHAVWTGCTLQV